MLWRGKSNVYVAEDFISNTMVLLSLCVVDIRLYLLDRQIDPHPSIHFDTFKGCRCVQNARPSSSFQNIFRIPEITYNDRRRSRCERLHPPTRALVHTSRAWKGAARSSQERD
jgi:hypothetical protein